MDYLWLKLTHQTAVTISLLGFVTRVAAGLQGAAWVRGRAARTWPHVVDTILLASALAMVVLADLPLDAPWLLAKIVGLLAYILLGAIAIRPTRPRRVRALAALAALGCFGYIVAVALTKDPAAPWRWLQFAGGWSGVFAA